MESYRQGDVLLVRVTDPVDLKRFREVPREGGRIILAEGEATGHHHAIAESGAVLLEDPDDVNVRFLQIMKDNDMPVNLVHEEHDTISLPEDAVFEVRRQREADPGPLPSQRERTRRVFD